MKLLLTIFNLSFLLFALTSASAQNTNPHYNPALADSLGADEYGMKSYVLVLLKTGSGSEDNPEIRAELFRGHLDNIGRLVESGQMVVAGPVGKNDLSYRGIFILNISTEEEVKALMQTDPAIAAGLLEPVIMPWYGSAALPAYIETHRKIEKSAP